MGEHLQQHTQGVQEQTTHSINITQIQHTHYRASPCWPQDLSSLSPLSLGSCYFTSSFRKHQLGSAPQSTPSCRYRHNYSVSTHTTYGILHDRATFVRTTLNAWGRWGMAGRSS